MSFRWQLRDLTSTDLEALLLIETELNAFPWNKLNFSDSLHAGHLSRCLTIDGEIAGFAIISVVLPEATLLNIGIARQHHGRGLGKRLLTEMLHLATSAGAEMCLLEVRRSNHAAHGLYQTLGFYEVGCRANYYPARRGREDAILMNLPLIESTHL